MHPTVFVFCVFSIQISLCFLVALIWTDYLTFALCLLLELLGLFGSVPAIKYTALDRLLISSLCPIPELLWLNGTPCTSSETNPDRFPTLLSCLPSADRVIPRRPLPVVGLLRTAFRVCTSVFIKANYFSRFL